MSTLAVTVPGMTHTDTTTAARSLPAFPDGDPRSFFARAVATAGATIATVRPDQLELPTPCPGYDVRHLLGHLMTVIERVGVIGAGRSPFEVPQEILVPGDGYGAAWTDAVARTLEVWTAEGVLDAMIQVPWAVLPGRVVMAIYTSELSTHTWDLAAATGQTPAFDEATVSIALEAMRVGLPAEGRDEAPFGDVVPVADDAPTIEHLVAWTGRDPRR